MLDIGDWQDEEMGNFHVPRVININRKIVDISMSYDFMLALTDDNRLYAFGNNYFGQCRQGTTDLFIEEPVQVKNLENVRIKQISAGWSHCLIKCTKF